MKVTLFTSNNHRHNYLINLLSNFCDELWVVQECNTLFTGKNDEKHQNKDIIEKYYREYGLSIEDLYKLNSINIKGCSPL